MPTLLVKDVGLVNGVGFDSWRRVGGALQAVRVCNMREVDELLFLDITATREGRSPDLAIVDELADECFMPLAVGGGIRTVEDVRNLLKVGADKVVVNSAAVETPALVGQIAQAFGSQCVVVSIDVVKTEGGYEVATHAGTKRTGLEPVAFAKKMAAMGAGEILLTSVERDGAMQGYALDVLENVARAVSVPVIASGGAGSYVHFAEALRAGASAVAAASMFHFTEATPREAKEYLATQGFPVRPRARISEI